MRKVMAAAMSLTLVTSMFTGCGASSLPGGKDPKEEYTAQVEKLSDMIGAESGSLSVDMSCDRKDTDEKVNIDSIFSGAGDTDTMDFDVDMSMAWGKESYSIDVGLCDEKAFTLYGDKEALYIDLSILSKILGTEDTPEQLKALATVIKLPYSDIEKLRSMGSDTGIETEESETSEKPSIDIVALRDNLVKTLTDAEVITAMQSLGDNAKLADGTIEMTGLTVEQLEVVVEAIANSAEKNGLADLLGALDDSDTEDGAEYVEGEIIEDESDIDDDMSPDIDNLEGPNVDSESSDVDADIKPEEDSTEDLLFDYKLTYSDDNLNQTHTLSSTDEEGTTTAVSFKISNDATGLADISDGAKTIEEITGMGLEESLQALLLTIAFSGMESSDEDMSFDEEIPIDSDTQSEVEIIDEIPSFE